jgi:hypothetical protein
MEELPRREADVAVAHLVNPANDPVPVGQDGGGKGELGPDQTLLMPQVEPVDELELLVGEESELRAEPLAERFGLSRRVDADGEDPNPFFRDLTIEFLELTQLRRAEGSPVAAIEEIERRALAEQAGGAKETAPGVGKLESGKSLADREPQRFAEEHRSPVHVPDQKPQTRHFDGQKRPLEPSGLLEDGYQAGGAGDSENRVLLVRDAPIDSPAEGLPGESRPEEKEHEAG